MKQVEIERDLYLMTIKNIESIKDDVFFPKQEDKLKAIFNVVDSVLDVEREYNDSK